MPGHDVFLGIDLGTTSVKAALVDEQGGPVGQLGAEYPLYQPRPNWAEQSPMDWWDRVREIIPALLRRCNVEGERVKGISISCQAPTCLGIDRNGNPVERAIIWMDRRSQEICDEKLSQYAEKIRATCVNRVDPYYFLPKYLWLRKYRREQEGQARWFLQANAWIVYKMTGAVSIDTTHLTHLQVYNVFSDTWDEELMEDLGIDRERFPQIFWPSQVVGELCGSVAKTLGLKAGTPVMAGCTDAAATAVGLHHVEPGRLFEMSGQSSGIGLIADFPAVNPLLNLSRGAFPNRWTQKGSMSTSGGALRWFRDQVDGQTGKSERYAQYDTLARQAPPGANGVIFLPYLAGERAPLWDSNACGMFFGLHATTGRADLIRAIMEGTAFGLRTILDVFDPSLLTNRCLYGTGGGYRSRLWAQIKADVLDMPIQVLHMEYDAASVGSAYLATEGVSGTHPTKMEHVKADAIYAPDQRNRELYEEGYQIFKELYRNNAPLMRQNMAFLCNHTTLEPEEITV